MKFNWWISLRTPPNKNISPEIAHKKIPSQNLARKLIDMYMIDHSWLEAGDSSYFMISSYVAADFNFVSLVYNKFAGFYNSISRILGKWFKKQLVGRFDCLGMGLEKCQPIFFELLKWHWWWWIQKKIWM